MAGVVLVREGFAILDEEAYLKEIYQSATVQLNPALFDINGPFLMDSQFEAMKNPNRRIRKRKRPFGENHLTTECQKIVELLPLIQEAGKEVGFFAPAASKDNNRRAREAAAEAIEKRPTLSGTAASEDKVILSEGDSITWNDGRWYSNPSSSTIAATIKDIPNSEFLMPPGATFCQSDVITINRYSGDAVELLVMDPPWFNRSAKRTAGYQLSDKAVCQLTLNCLSEEGLCGIWITNRKELKEEVLSMAKGWNLQLIATWNWLKVTSEGEPVCDFHSSHKVPFETLLLFCRPSKLLHWRPQIRESFIFASVPMALHSRKPPLPLLLRTFDLALCSSCELFARSLLPNCISVGFEPLLLQNQTNFIPK